MCIVKSTIQIDMTIKKYILFPQNKIDLYDLLSSYDLTASSWIWPFTFNLF